VRTRSCALSFEVPAPSFEWIVGNPAVKLPMSGALFALQGHCVLRQGQGLPPPLRSGQVSLDEAERFYRTIDLPASLRSDGVQDYPGMPFGFPPELVFSFAGIPTQPTFSPPLCRAHTMMNTFALGHRLRSMRLGL